LVICIKISNLPMGKHFTVRVKFSIFSHRMLGLKYFLSVIQFITAYNILLEREYNYSHIKNKNLFNM
jgi:hypothetical protein